MEDRTNKGADEGLAREKRCAWCKSNHEKGQSGDPCENDREAAGKDVVRVHRLAFVCGRSRRYVSLTTRWGRMSLMNTVHTE
jgi:hypothetical protein